MLTHDADILVGPPTNIQMYSSLLTRNSRTVPSRNDAILSVRGLNLCVSQPTDCDVGVDCGTVDPPKT